MNMFNAHISSTHVCTPVEQTDATDLYTHINKAHLKSIHPAPRSFANRDLIYIKYRYNLLYVLVHVLR